MAQAKDKRLSEEEKSLLKETMLLNKNVSFGHNGSRGGLRINVFSASQSRGPKRWFAV